MNPYLGQILFRAKLQCQIWLDWDAPLLSTDLNNTLRLLLLLLLLDEVNILASHKTSHMHPGKTYLEGLLDAFLAAVLHQLEFAIRGHEADHLFRVELAQVHALVEGHILRSTPHFSSLLLQPHWCHVS